MMNNNVETSFIAPYHQLNKKVFFNSSNSYHTFINWVSGEFDLFLQDDFNGLMVYFPGGSFHIKNDAYIEPIVAEINMESKNIENGQIIFNKIISLYNLVSKTNK
jgi:hypothetical protein